MKKGNFSKSILSKAAAVVLVLVAAIMVSLTMDAELKRVFKVIGPDEKTALGVFETSSVSYIEVVEEDIQKIYPTTAIEDNGDILIKLTPDLNFRMILVEGGVDYALQSSDITWTTAQKTKRIENFYLGQFEVTQGLWKNIKGSLPTDGTQTKVADNCPVAFVSWDMIAGTASDTFLKLINAKLTEIKKNNPAVVAVLGSREFRLPSEWEWEYAAAGGKNWASLNYYYSGTSESTAAALETVAVNKVSPNTASSVAAVGSKLPNALGLYDMSGNVFELCSGLGYPANPTTPGYQDSKSSTLSPSRPYRGGSWYLPDSSGFRVSSRNLNSSSYVSYSVGFRLAL